MGGPSSSRCAGLSLSRPLLLQSAGSRRAGSVVVAHGPSCSAACGIFPPGLEPVSPALAGRFSTTVQPRKPHIVTIFFVVVVVRTLKIYSINKSKVYNTVLLTIIIMLYVESPEVIHIITIFQFFAVFKTSQKRRHFISYFLYFLLNKLKQKTKLWFLI